MNYVDGPPVKVDLERNETEFLEKIQVVKNMLNLIRLNTDE